MLAEAKPIRAPRAERIAKAFISSGVTSELELNDHYHGCSYIRPVSLSERRIDHSMKGDKRQNHRLLLLGMFRLTVMTCSMICSTVFRR